MMGFPHEYVEIAGRAGEKRTRGKRTCHRKKNRIAVAAPGSYHNRYQVSHAISLKIRY